MRTPDEDLTFMRYGDADLPQVHRIDLIHDEVEMTDGSTRPITQYLDDAGAQTFNPGRAVVCIAGRPGQWMTIVLNPDQ